MIPEIQDFEDDCVESHPQNAELGDYISFSDLFSVCLRTIDHLIKIEISKVQDFGNFDLSPMYPQHMFWLRNKINF